MNDEKLIEGNELSEKIQGLKKYIGQLVSILDSQSYISCSSIRVDYNKHVTGNLVYTADINIQYIESAIILQINESKKALENLEKEFKEL